MGKFSAVGGRTPKNPLPDFNPYAKAQEEVAKKPEVIAKGAFPEQVTPTTTQLGPQQAAAGETAGVIDPVSLQGQSPVLQETGSLRPKNREELIAQTALETDPETQQAYGVEAATARVDAELAKQEEQGYQGVDLANLNKLNDADSELESVAKSQADAVISKGSVIGQEVGNVFNNTLNDPSNQSSTEFLAKTGMIEGGSISPRLGNAIAIAIPSMIKDDLNKREKSKTGLATDADSWEDTDISGRPSFDPALTQGNLVGEIMKLVNPNQGEQGFYTKDRDNNLTKDPGAAAVEAGLWKALFNKGLVEEYRPEPNAKPRYRWSATAVDYFNGTTDIMSQINPKQKIEPSLHPSFQGRTYGKEILSKSGSNISINAKASKNQNIENAVKDTLGRMPLKVNAQRAAMLKGMWDDVNKNIIEQGWSTSAFAGLFRLDEGRFNKFKNKAKGRITGAMLQQYSQPEIDQMINDIATKNMAEEFKKIGADMVAATETYADTTFYNKWFHASANGRYHVRNSVLNFQDSKFARVLVENAVDTPIKVGAGTQLERNWKYIVSRNLKPYREIRQQSGKIERTSVEDLGWTKTLEVFDGNLNNWASIGEMLVDPNRQAEAAAFISDAMNKNKEDDGYIDHENFGYVTQSYIDAYEYKKARDNNSSFSPKAQVQHDGKQNGLAIQAIQAGDLGLMKKVGLMYDDDGVSVIPDGDIRGAFIQRLPRVAEGVFTNDKLLAATYGKAIASLSEKQKKDLSKGPLMETAYGKWHEYHRDAAFNFLENNRGFLQIIQNEFPNKDMNTIVNEVNQLISGTLQDVLNLDHQQRLKRVGDLWGALGVTPAIEGPLGNHVFFGSKAFIPDIDPDTGLERTVTLQTPTGTITTPVGTVGPTTAGQPVAKLAREATGEVKAQAQRVGAIIPNQFPVLTVQHIDAAVMADAILRVNADRRNPKHVLPVHDAIITDASSVRDYHSQINESFVNINKGYNIAEKVQQGFLDALRKWQASINPNGNYNVHPDSGPYKALFALVEQQWQRNQEAEAAGKNVSEANKYIIKLARDIGINPDRSTYLNRTNYIKGSQLVSFMKELNAKLGATRKLNSWKDDIHTNQKKNWGMINKYTYQYN